jgi:hypothetical protein
MEMRGQHHTLATLTPELGEQSVWANMKLIQWWKCCRWFRLFVVSVQCGWCKCPYKFCNLESLIYLCFQTVSIPFVTKVKDGTEYLEYQSDDVQDNVYLAVLRQSYQMFRLFKGSFTAILSSKGGDVTHLKQKLDHFFSRVRIEFFPPYIQLVRSSSNLVVYYNIKICLNYVSSHHCNLHRFKPCNIWLL